MDFYKKNDLKSDLKIDNVNGSDDYENGEKWLEKLEKAAKEGRLIDRGLNPDDYFPVCEFTGDEIF